jgi:hypothetical protein
MIDESQKLRGQVKISICYGDTCETEILECAGQFSIAEVGTVIQRHAYDLLIQTLDRDAKGEESKI